MFRTIKTLFVLMALGIAAASCEKEYSAEFGGSNNGGTQSGTAVFTLEGAPATCTLPTISGTYTAGTALTAAEKITLQVNVTTAGTFTISTGQINGVAFAGSGSFATTGPTFIELTAVGSIPASAGIFEYSPGVNGCKFQVTYVVSTGTSSGTAVFTLNGAPDDCQTPVISGTYVEGEALTAANTVKLLVDVQTAGTYTITTASSNGIKFSATGSFAAPGPNEITLVGSGTPVDAATIQYSPGGSGCSFNITVTPGSATPATGTIKATVAGVATTFNTNITGQNESSGSNSAVILYGMMNDTDHDDIQVSFINLTGAITTGSYANFSATNPIKSLLVIYTDHAGVQWQTSLSIDNTFTGTISALSATNVKGTFSGTLYNNDGGGPGTLAITNGSFDINF